MADGSSTSPAGWHVLHSQLRDLCGHERGDGSTDPLSGQRAGRTRDLRQYHRAGAIETDFGGGRVRDDAQLNQLLASQTALGRVGLPDDIGDAIAALLSDKLGWMNAQRIEVSGGMFL